jgi:hypothetical protein
MLGVSLVILSTLFYLLHYVIFRDWHHIFICMIEAIIAFVFFGVLPVTQYIASSVKERTAQGWRS